MAMFLNTDISQGGVATYLRCDSNLPLSLPEKILKIGKRLGKLWARVVFSLTVYVPRWQSSVSTFILGHGVVISLHCPVKRD